MINKQIKQDLYASIRVVETKKGGKQVVSVHDGNALIHRGSREVDHAFARNVIAEIEDAYK